MCFNGAVTFSLRKSVHPIRDEGQGVPRLQWGRNFFVTEISRHDGRTYRILCFNGAVTFSLRKYDDVLIGSGSPPRFNGAVTFSLRKFLSSAGYALSKPASMGP